MNGGGNTPYAIDAFSYQYRLQWAEDIPWMDNMTASSSKILYTTFISDPHWDVQLELGVDRLDKVQNAGSRESQAIR